MFGAQVRVGREMNERELEDEDEDELKAGKVC